MKRIVIRTALAAGVVLGLASLALAFGRGGFRGGGGYRYGGGYGGGYRYGGGYHAGAAVGPYGGYAAGHRAGGSIVGPAGGAAGYRTGGGTVTTPRGGSVHYGGTAVGREGPAGGAAGRYVGGVQVTTPGGRTATRVGTGAGAVGPGGRAVGGRTTVGAAAGPRGATAGVRHTGTAVGPGGAIHGSYRGGVAVGPYGAAAGGARTVSAVGGVGAATVRRGTYHVTGATMTAQGAYVRGGFRHYGAFTTAWYGRYPGVWRPVGWAARAAWYPATWALVASTCGYPAVPVYYDYGSNVVYQGDTVYVNGDVAGSTEQYAQQAVQLADTGRAAPATEKSDWQALGVFALAREGEPNSDKIFQLAVNKAGVIRGNYYDAFADNVLPVYGSVDNKTQRAAWSIGKKKDVVFEAGIANLTRDETPILVHYGTENTQQFMLIRIERPDEDADSAAGSAP